MLFRVIIACEMAGSAGTSVLSVAQIVGVSERNNRRDDITSGLLIHNGWCLHGMEGRRADLDRLLRRLGDDRRLRNIRLVADDAITHRWFCEPISLCEDPEAILGTIGSPDLARITAYEAERILELKKAA